MRGGSANGCRRKRNGSMPQGLKCFMLQAAYGSGLRHGFIRIRVFAHTPTTAIQCRTLIGSIVSYAGGRGLPENTSDV